MLKSHPGRCLLPSTEHYLAILHKVGAELLAAGVAKEDWASALVGPVELHSTSSAHDTVDTTRQGKVLIYNMFNITAASSG